MPLPQLNTGGIDVSQTLAALEAREQNSFRNQLLSQQYANKETAATSTNAFKLVEQRIKDREAKVKEQQEGRAAAEAKRKQVIQDVAWLKGHPTPEAAYEILRDRYIKEKISMPDASAFYAENKDGEYSFDLPKFEKYADSGIRAWNLAAHPKEGETVEHVEPNPAFDPSRNADWNNAKFIKKHYTSTQGQLRPTLGIPDTPMVDPFTEAKRKQYEADTSKMQAETAEGRLKKEETEVEVKQLLQNRRGELIVILKDATPRMITPNGLVKPTELQLRSATKLARQLEPMEILMFERLGIPLPGSVSASEPTSEPLEPLTPQQKDLFEYLGVPLPKNQSTTESTSSGAKEVPVPQKPVIPNAPAPVATSPEDELKRRGYIQQNGKWIKPKETVVPSASAPNVIRYDTSGKRIR